MEEFMNQYGNTASVLSLLLAIMILIIKEIKKYKYKKEKQNQEYQKIKQEINELANSASTITKRQDVFMYVNESLGQGRHIEIRMRISVVVMDIMTFIITIGIYNLFLYNDLTIYNNYLLIIANILLIIPLYNIHNEHKEFGKLNDLFSDGYLESISKHIDKTISNKSLEEKQV